VVTCSASREHALPPPASPAPLPPLDPAAAPSAHGGAAPPLETPRNAEFMPDPPRPSAPLSAATRAARADGHELDGFYAALRGLEKHVRAEHVRVAWLGDSHGASDFWSGALRTALQKRFGNGGSGFIHAGFRAYRHDGVKIEVPGNWKLHPKGPAGSTLQGDGVYGLGGMLFSSDTPGQPASLTLTEPAAPALTWDVCYKLNAPRDELTVRLGTDKPVIVRASAAQPAGVLRHLTLTGSGATSIRIAPGSSAVELCGVTVETDPRVQPGVVLDTLGINGARLTTPLAWDEANWTAELSRRTPTLVVLEYGTNEASDHFIKPDRVTENLGKLMARVRHASPNVDCLVLAPTERADTSARMPAVRDALKGAARFVGCGFWDTYETMGGQGSILAWRGENPPRAAADGIHLTFRGYRELGDRLAAELLRPLVP
jgi:lysophospholipase L1-like esterase